MSLDKKVEQAICDLRSDCECEKVTYCPIAILLHANPRVLEQHKCVEVWKYLQSEKQKKDVGWDEAYMSWAESGMAKKFADAYSEDKSFRQLKKELFS